MNQLHFFFCFCRLHFPLHIYLFYLLCMLKSSYSGCLSSRFPSPFFLIIIIVIFLLWKWTYFFFFLVINRGWLGMLFFFFCTVWFVSRVKSSYWLIDWFWRKFCLKFVNDLIKIKAIIIAIRSFHVGWVCWLVVVPGHSRVF